MNVLLSSLNSLGIMVLWYTFSTMASDGPHIFRIRGSAGGPKAFYFLLSCSKKSSMDVECIQMLFNAWFLDDGVLAGTKSAVLRAMHLIEELGPPFGIFINLAKCELFSRNELSSTFPVSS